MNDNLYRSLAVAVALTAGNAAAQATEAVTVRFINHMTAGLNEIDVFTVHPSEPSSYVFRPTQARKGEERKHALYASARPVPHNPFDDEAVGPFPKGRALGITLEQWLSAEGAASVSCSGNTGRVSAQFTKLVPNAVYTMWYAFVPTPPTKPFTGALDLPLGARDGSQTEFASDAAGNAHFEASFSPCLQPSNDQLMAMLAIAWHSDGKTHGSSGGPFGKTSHVQIFAPLPPTRAVTN
jgi:hypothetical protein